MANPSDVGKVASPIIPNGQTTVSQERKSQSYPSVSKSEAFSDGIEPSSSADDASEQPTGILMVTLPESSDDYHTPPEHRSYSQNSSNDDEAPEIKTAAVGDGDREAMEEDDDCEQQVQMITDLAKDSDNLGFSEKSPTVLEETNTLMADEIDTEQIEVESKSKEIDTENPATETVDVDLISSKNQSAHQVFVKMPKRKLKVADCSKHVVFKDTLNQVLQILANARKNRVSDDDVDLEVDFIETAKKKGMTFPRPRWWPPEESKDPEGSNSKDYICIKK